MADGLSMRGLEELIGSFSVGAKEIMLVISVLDFAWHFTREICGV